jgi:MFS family permease
MNRAPVRVVEARHDLTPLETGALVSLLAATTALLQPWAGKAHDRAALPRNAGPGALLLAATRFVIAALIANVAGIAIAALLIGAGVAISTPIGFATLAATPTGRMRQTIGAGEVGRELGDAGGPILVGGVQPGRPRDRPAPARRRGQPRGDHDLAKTGSTPRRRAYRRPGD